MFAQESNANPTDRALGRWRWLAAAAVTGGIVSALAWADGQRSPDSAPTAPAPIPAAVAAVTWQFVKSGNVSAWNVSNADKVFVDAQRLALTTITVPVRVNLASAATNEMTIDPVSLAFAKEIVLRSQAYHYIIEPYPWIANGGVPETDLDPSDKAAWFAAYERTLVALTRQFPQVWGIYVASNLVKIEDQTPRWLSVIQAVRASFGGKVIYRTQWWVTADWEPSTLKAWQAKLANPVFGAVDIIAIAAYFELSELPAPTVAELKAALRSTTVHARKQDVFAEIIALQSRWNKPIFLGELSCPAVDFAATAPWDPAAGDRPNPSIQKNLLSAYLETLPQDPAKFLGFSIFTIGHPTATSYDLTASAAEYVRSYRPRTP